MMFVVVVVDVLLGGSLVVVTDSILSSITPQRIPMD
jgi:hypothetical protein